MKCNTLFSNNSSNIYNYKVSLSLHRNHLLYITDLTLCYLVTGEADSSLD